MNTEINALANEIKKLKSKVTLIFVSSYFKKEEAANIKYETARSILQQYEKVNVFW